MKKLVYLLLGLIAVVCVACEGGTSSSKGKIHLTISHVGYLKDCQPENESDLTEILYDGDVDITSGQTPITILDVTNKPYTYSTMREDYGADADNKKLKSWDVYEIVSDQNDENYSYWVFQVHDKNGESKHGGIYLPEGNDKPIVFEDGDIVEWIFYSHGDKYPSPALQYKYVHCIYYEMKWNNNEKQYEYKKDSNGMVDPDVKKAVRYDKLERKDPFYVAYKTAWAFSNKSQPYSLDETIYVENYGWTGDMDTVGRSYYYKIYIQGEEYTPSLGLCECQPNDIVEVYMYPPLRYDVVPDYYTNKGIAASTLEKSEKNLRNTLEDIIVDDTSTNIEDINTTNESNTKNVQGTLSSEQIAEIQNELLSGLDTDSEFSDIKIKVVDDEVIYTYFLKEMTEKVEGKDLEEIKNSLLNYAKKQAQRIVELTGIEDAFVTLEYKNPDGSKVYTASSGAEEAIYFGR